jgi:plasmid stabilization system protein ParE
MRITWSRRAHRELDAVLAFIAQDNPQAAEEIVEKIIGAVTMLAKFPQMGKQTVDPKFRSLALLVHDTSSNMAFLTRKSGSKQITSSTWLRLSGVFYKRSNSFSLRERDGDESVVL